MSAKVSQKKSRKPKVAPEPIVVKEEVIAESIPEPVHEPEPEVEQAAGEIVETGSNEGDSKDDSKNQKKKIVYEELKNDIDDLLNEILEDASEARTSKNKALLSILKGYEKKLKKIRGNIKKVEPKDKRTVTRTQPSGFNKPLPISQEIADFAGWPVDELKSRTDVTVSLCDYVKKNNLQKPEHRRIIIPDDKLAKILRYDSKTEPPLTYSTMQKYIGHLFKTESIAA